MHTSGGSGKGGSNLLTTIGNCRLSGWNLRMLSHTLRFALSPQPDPTRRYRTTIACSRFSVYQLRDQAHYASDIPANPDCPPMRKRRQRDLGLKWCLDI